MVCLIIAVVLICLSVKGYCAKRTSIYIEDTGDAFLFNLVRMVFCSLIGIVLVLTEGSQGHLAVDWRMSCFGQLYRNDILWRKDNRPQCVRLACCRGGHDLHEYILI